MSKRNNRSTNIGNRSFFGRLPWVGNKKMTRRHTGGRRTKKVFIRLSRKTNLAISFRSFKTNKASRSKSRSQLILPALLPKVREISLGVQRRKGVKKDIQPSFFRLDKHLRAAPSMAIIMLGMGGTLYFGINVNRPVDLRLASSAVPVVEQQAPLPPSPKALPPAQPTKVRIPKVGIDAGLVELGMKADRTIETPSTYVDAGWYKLGRTPGEIGPAVIVGHVDSAKDGPAVFWRLRELQPGDIIEVDRSDSTTARFKVDKIEQFSQSEFPTDQVYGNIDYAGVRLITCGGAYDGKVNRYSHNTVVFGSLLI